MSHSLSPVLHRAAYDALGLDSWSYRAVECRAVELGATLSALDAEGLAGVSLTMPLKRAVVPLLARVERLAGDVGAVNTVTFGGIAGEWWGANTDVPGMLAALGPFPQPWRQPPWVLGSGATAASAIAALAGLGAREVIMVSRRESPELAAVASRFAVRLEARPWAELPGCTAAPLVVSTTPPGATDAAAGGVRAAVAGTLFDVVYAPWPTPLATAWSAAGGRVVGGLELLVEQAAEQVRLMTGHSPPTAVMRAAGQEALTGGHR